MKNFGIYIHWPFCETKCPYCDFNSHVKKNLKEKEWIKPYLKSLRYWKEYYDGYKVSSIFFGGGTPSLMSPLIVEEIINEISKLWILKSNIEISLEANPNSVDIINLKNLSKIGINRTSIGIQALNDLDLRRLGRNHTKDEAIKSLNICKDMFENVSFDLIYGRQFQKLKTWEDELTNALKMNTNHISLYMLTIEEGTKFYEMKTKGKLNGMPKIEEEVEFYKTTNEICEQYNFQRYEISNFSKNNTPCYHNLNYWKYGDYLGIGPGAHGRITQNFKRYRTEAPKIPEKWKNDVENDKISEFLIKEIKIDEQKQEYLMTSLRLEEGLDKSKFLNITKKKISKNQISFLKKHDLLTEGDNFLKATEKGKLLLNKLIYYLCDTI